MSLTMVEQNHSSTDSFPTSETNDDSLTKFSGKVKKSKEKRPDRKSVSFPFGKCRVCQDSATGVHYGVVTCEGCKGFFKRSISQGVPYRCFFGDQCSINMETRNRCKACRFKRCLDEGMAIESVKMGRIPKRLKEKALRELEQEKNLKTISYSSEFHGDKISVESEIFENPEEIFQTSNIVEKTLKELEVDNEKKLDDLATFRLPEIFYRNFDTTEKKNSIRTEMNQEENSNEERNFTVKNFISKINRAPLVDSMFSYEIRYGKNVLPTMKYLASKISQPFLIHELDFEISSFFRYIRWKMLNIYLKHGNRVRNAIERMFGIIELGITDYPGCRATPQQLWCAVQATIASHVREVVAYTLDTPGLNEINRVDINRIVNNRIFDAWMTINYPLFYKGESYVMTSNGLQYSRHFMNQFIGKTTTDCLHDFAEALHALKITHIEHSLFIPIVLCLPDPEIIDPYSLHIVKYCYMYAFYIQLCTTRTEEEAKFTFEKIVQLIDEVSILNKLCQQNIGQLKLDESATHE